MNDPLLDLLRLATSRPAEALAFYQRDDHHLHTIREAGETVALIGIRLTQDEATILQIAVAPAHQGKSLGEKYPGVERFLCQYDRQADSFPLSLDTSPPN
ncbi:GNAT family N-acetyltransferase [Exiguobacterium flavidum]|uniref:GNAT family N-acetyltransferase n=1 Tax=Exiguobacterium flavidum TaxID=2184695 RepID=UPI000DF82AC1|nr:GNAT family N-acetyltransferase [Exiguobacterium flavidum]